MVKYKIKCLNQNNWEATLNWPVEEKPRGSSSAGRKSELVALNNSGGGTVVERRTTYQTKDSVVKATESFGFFKTHFKLIMMTFEKCK